MIESVLEYVAGVVIGLVAGVASGLAGIGGGVIMVPSMVFLLDSPQHLAQGTSLFAIAFTSLAGTAINRRNLNVDVRRALIIGGVGAVTAFAAARLANQLDGEMLARLFGVLVLVSGIRMLIQGLRDDGSAEE